MEAISLPVVSPMTSPNDAIKMMAEARRSAVVVDDGQSLSLLLGGDVAAARSRGVAQVADVKNGRPVHAISRIDLDQFPVDVLRPHQTMPAFEDLLGRAQTQYGALSIARDQTILITARERFAAELVLPGVFQCDGPDTHYFPEPIVVENQRCPSCLPLGIVSTVHFARY